MFRLFRIHIDFPALDRLLNYLEAQQQGEVNAAADRLTSLSARLKQHRETLESQVQENTPHAD